MTSLAFIVNTIAVEIFLKHGVKAAIPRLSVELLREHFYYSRHHSLVPRLHFIRIDIGYDTNNVSKFLVRFQQHLLIWLALTEKPIIIVVIYSIGTEP